MREILSRQIEFHVTCVISVTIWPGVFPGSINSVNVGKEICGPEHHNGREIHSGKRIVKSDRLSTRHERFCREYLIDGCGKRAYIRAGYAPKSAEVCASQLLRKPKVAARIVELRADQAKRLQFDADDVLRALIPLCTSDITDLIDRDGRFVEDLSTLPHEIVVAIESYNFTRRPNGTVIVSVKFWNKITALALAGKHKNVQAFVKQARNGGRGPVIIDVVRTGDDMI